MASTMMSMEIGSREKWDLSIYPYTEQSGEHVLPGLFSHALTDMEVGMTKILNRSQYYKQELTNKIY
jgi:hypothetical protein